MLRSAFVADATEAVHASLDLDEVVQRVVDQSCRLVGAGSASLRLADDEGDLRPVAAQVDIAGQGAGRADRAERRPAPGGRPHRRAGAAQLRAPCRCCASRSCATDRLLGLITLGAGAADRFSDDDAALLGRFAAPAANAIANAQRYEAAVFLLDRDSDDVALTSTQSVECGQIVQG